MRATSTFWLGLFRRMLAFWPIILPVLILLPGVGAFSYPVGTGYSDIPVAHYPNAIFLRQAIQTYHAIPLWSPTILSGYPFAANPLSGLWYPPGWLALLLPLPLGFNLAMALHLVWGGLGMYALLRGEGLGHPAALVGAAGFAAMPKLFAHFGAGHLTLLYAVPWTPWLLAMEARSKARGERPARMNWQSAIILALIFLADPRWVIFAGAAWIVYRFLPVKTNALIAAGLKDLAVTLSTTAGVIALAGLLAAPLALPLVEYTRLSTRTDLQSSDVFTLSLPPGNLLGLLFPTFKISHEWVLYPGGVILTLAVLGFVMAMQHRCVRFWVGLVLASTLFSLGSNLPPLIWLARLPGFDLLRVPPRALFLAGMGWTALAACAVEWILTGSTAEESRKAGLVLTFSTSFVVFLAAGIWLVTGFLPVNIAWGAGVTALIAASIGLYLAGKFSARICYVFLLLMCLVELWWIDQQLFTTRPAQAVLAENEAVASYLKALPGHFRVYSPSYSLPQQTAVRFGLELADGVDPLQLRTYVTYMDLATGVPRIGYSVTLPPQAKGDPTVANKGYQPDLGMLSLLNVRYIVSEYDLTIAANRPELELRTQIGQTRVYENLLAFPRTWVQSAEFNGNATTSTAEVVKWSPNEIAIQANGPGTLILSEVAYPGWGVQVDGQKADLDTWSGLLRAVDIGTGLHRVVMSFHPASVYVGLTAAGMGWLAVVGLALRRRYVAR